MTRRFEVGPILVALGAAALLVSLFLDWYGPLTAWDAFEVVEVLLAALADIAFVIAAGQLMPDLEYVARGRLPAVVAAVVALIAAEIINPPPAAAGEPLSAGAWIAFGAAVLMFIGAVLTFGRVSFAVSVEGRDEVRERVPVVDHRQDTTETAAVTPTRDGPGGAAARTEHTSDAAAPRTERPGDG
jgi:hypothetical protein